MSNKRNASSPAGHARKTLLLAALLIAALAMTGCYMEPDRVVDDTNGLAVATNGQQFQTVITPTPVVTATPVPSPTTANQQVDWSNWDFGNDTATNPPSNVINIGDNTGATATGGIAVGLSTPTPKPTGATTSTSTTLKSGASGADVKKLQQRLKDLGYYSGSVDGNYGAGTASAVKSFQAANSLTSDGVAGSKTLDAVYSYYAKKKTTGSTSSNSTSNTSTSHTNTTTSTTANKYTNGKTDVYLQLGSTGAQVKILQNRLIVLGYLSGTADGTFAETTEAAVTAFQKRNSIFADGVAGPTTLTKLYSSSAKKASSVVATLGSLKPGMTGGGVRSLQSKLKELGYYTGSVDGDYGDGTTTAVVAFQNANGLTADGIAGQSTLNALFGGSGGGSTGGGTNPDVYAVSASTNGYSTIASNSGTSKANITALQSSLSSNGYYSGTLDGDYGDVTTTAVKAFQEAKGLRVTGTAGPSTQRLLYGGTAASGSYTKLQKGSTGTAVKNLQYTLYEMKYYDGKITGTYDDATFNAVLIFQQVNALTMDGIAGQDTQRVLYSSAAKPCDI